MDHNENRPPKSEPNSLQSSAPATEAQIIAHLTVLTTFYGRQGMDEGMFRAWLRTFIDDLHGKSDAQLAYACRRYRMDGANRFLPTPGQLSDLCVPEFDTPERKHTQGRMTEHGFQPWAGCQCDRCMKKTPREGFYRASAADQARGAAERREMAYWMESQLGYDPKIGDPSLDNRSERQRSTAEIKALLDRTRAKYPSIWRAR